MFRFSSKLFLRTDEPRNDGTCLLCIRAFINKVPCVEPLGIHIHPENWDRVGQTIVYCPSKPLPRSRVLEMKKLLDAKCDRVYQIRTKYEQQGKFLTKAIFRAEFRKVSMGINMHQFILSEIEVLRPDREPDTIKIYEKVQRKLKDFQNEILFADINLNLVQRFENYLIQKKLDVNTRWSVHKIFKMFVRRAKAEYPDIVNPYEQFKSFSAETDMVFLDISEMMICFRAFNNKELADHLHEELRRFLFACTTGGQRISDASRLTHENINGDNLVFFMYKNRRRKKKKITIPISKNSLSLIPPSYGLLFPKKQDPVINRQLKEIASILGIRKNITFKTARHTFATQFLYAGGKVEVLQQLLGHSDINTTMKYVHIVDRAKRDQMQAFDEQITRELFSYNKITVSLIDTQ